MTSIFVETFGIYCAICGKSFRASADSLPAELTLIRLGNESGMGIPTYAVKQRTLESERALASAGGWGRISIQSGNERDICPTCIRQVQDWARG